MKYANIYSLLLLFWFNTSCKAQDKVNASPSPINSPGPDSGVRNIKQDKKGNIWIASNDGVFKYDGRSFTNITCKVTPVAFHTVLEDRKGNFWFASLGSGVFYYDGTIFRNLTTKDGLAHNGVIAVYEDKAGHIWFGTEGGVSRYDGKSFRNFSMKEGLPSWEPPLAFVKNEKPSDNRVNAILEDKTGKLWFGTRGEVYTYDGNTLTAFPNKYGNPFINVRSIIEDKKGNIWLGGPDGLWRYDGRTYTGFTRNGVGQVYEDKKGNIWITSERVNDRSWLLSRYDEKSLSTAKPTVTEIDTKTGRLIFGILEANDGSIWFGSGGVRRYDGKTITSVN